MKYKKIIALFSLVMIFAIPLAAGAAGISAFKPLPETFDINIINILESIFNILWPIVVTVVIIAFIFAGFKFLTAQGDPAKIAVARIAVVWAAVGVAVIVLSASAVLIVTDLIDPPAPPGLGCNAAQQCVPGGTGGSCSLDADCQVGPPPPPPSATGACCKFTGVGQPDNCQILTQASCSDPGFAPNQGDIYQGDGTDCNAGCPQR